MHFATVIFVLYFGSEENPTFFKWYISINCLRGEKKETVNL